MNKSFLIIFLSMTTLLLALECHRLHDLVETKNIYLKSAAEGLGFCANLIDQYAHENGCDLKKDEIF